MFHCSAGSLTSFSPQLNMQRFDLLCLLIISLEIPLLLLFIQILWAVRRVTHLTINSAFKFFYFSLLQLLHWQFSLIPFALLVSYILFPQVPIYHARMIFSFFIFTSVWLGCLFMYVCWDSATKLSKSAKELLCFPFYFYQYCWLHVRLIQLSSDGFNDVTVYNSHCQWERLRKLGKNNIIPH